AAAAASKPRTILIRNLTNTSGKDGQRAEAETAVDVMCSPVECSAPVAQPEPVSIAIQTGGVQGNVKRCANPLCAYHGEEVAEGSGCVCNSGLYSLEGIDSPGVESADTMFADALDNLSAPCTPARRTISSQGHNSAPPGGHDAARSPTPQALAAASAPSCSAIMFPSLNPLVIRTTLQSAATTRLYEADEIRRNELRLRITPCVPQQRATAACQSKQRNPKSVRASDAIRRISTSSLAAKKLAETAVSQLLQTAQASDSEIQSAIDQPMTLSNRPSSRRKNIG
ncbi:potassium voltage-gated channel protein Shab-like, partial [Tropilaelaps mercedesae]